jgi:hypothetical protein
MAKLQKKIFKDGYGGYVEFSNIVSSSVTNPHSTFIQIISDGVTHNRWVNRYIDLDSIGPFKLDALIYNYLDSIKDELYETQWEAQMAYNNKKFLNNLELQKKEIVDWKDLPDWEELKLQGEVTA